PFTVDFSGSVTGFDASDVDVVNGTVTGFSGTGASYSFGVVPAGQGLVSVSVAADKATDANGLGNLASNSVSRTYDNIAPSVTLATTAANPTNTSPIPVTVSFDESVTGFDATDLNLTNATVANFAGSGANYSFDLIPSGQGLVSVSVDANQAFDAANN